MIPSLLQPAWPAPAHVKAVFTTRAGGVSAAPFDSLNLGDYVHDQPAHVAHNRALLAQSIGARPVFLKQVHGVQVATLDAATADGTVADACITQAQGPACTITVADCLPVLLTDRAGSFVAAAHAGWRGLAGQGGHGVLEAALQAAGPPIYEANQPPAQQNIAGAAIKNVANEYLAWLGPCIGPQAFEVGEDVRAAFVSLHKDAAAHFKPLTTPGKYLANLPALARDRLRAMGITQIYGNDGSLDWCTVSNPSRFFSHRRDALRLGSTGRMAACIWLAG